MIRECDLPSCSRLQRVVVRDPVGDQLHVCFDHWREAVEVSDGLIRGIALIDAPPCSHPTCDRDAELSVPDFHGGRAPMCRKHLDDFSLISTPQSLLDDHLASSDG